MCEIASGKLLRELSPVPCDDLEGWDGGGSSERGGICVHIAHSHHYTAEMNAALWSSYTPIKEKIQAWLAVNLWDTFYNISSYKVCPFYILDILVYKSLLSGLEFL